MKMEDRKNTERDKLMEENKQFRIESLERLIPEMIYLREKRSNQRFLLTFIAIYLLTFIIQCKLGIATIVTRLWLSLIITILLFVVSYIISSLTFFANIHEALMIEKLKTEYYTLTNKQDDYDMISAIGSMRDRFPFSTLI